MGLTYCMQQTLHHTFWSKQVKTPSKINSCMRTVSTRLKTLLWTCSASFTSLLLHTPCCFTFPVQVTLDLLLWSNHNLLLFDSSTLVEQHINLSLPHLTYLNLSGWWSVKISSATPAWFPEIKTKQNRDRMFDKRPRGTHDMLSVKFFNLKLLLSYLHLLLSQVQPWPGSTSVDWRRFLIVSLHRFTSW